MVRATDLDSFTDFIKFEEHSQFASNEMIQLHMQEDWLDETPPDTPRFGSPDLILADDGLFLDAVAKSVERNSDCKFIVDFDSMSPKSACSPDSVMWNMDSTIEPSCKLVPSTTSSASVSPCEYFKSPVALEFELFAVEDLSSDDDAFRCDSATGVKRKAMSVDLEAKKAKARQTRDALATEAQLRLLGADHPDNKRMTHNVLERKRRNDLKASYQDLRENIPELVHQERAPTAQILQKAVEHIEALKQTEDQLLAAMAVIRAENERLRSLVVRA